MYFVRGNLPWQERFLGGGKGGTKEDKYKRILDKKERRVATAWVWVTKQTGSAAKERSGKPNCVWVSGETH